MTLAIQDFDAAENGPFEIAPWAQPGVCDFDEKRQLRKNDQKAMRKKDQMQPKGD